VIAENIRRIVRSEAPSTRFADRSPASPDPDFERGTLRCYTASVIKESKLVGEIGPLAEPYCARKGKKFWFDDVDPGDTPRVKSEKHAEQLPEKSIGILRHMQEKLYAQDNWALLLIFPLAKYSGQARKSTTFMRDRVPGRPSCRCP
jgi:hypothetical protein